MRILITGTTGDAMPPPYAGIPKVSLLYATAWRKMGQEVGVTFVYKPHNADDQGAGADYFFEYDSKPNKFKKTLFLIKFFLKNPKQYVYFFRKYVAVNPRISLETILYSAYGVWVHGVIGQFKPDVILCQAALIKAFMASESAKLHNIPVFFNTYAEVHDLRMGVNKHMDEKQREKYWTYFMNLSHTVIGMDNCSVGPLMYLPKERVKVFYDTVNFSAFQIPLTDIVQERRDFFNLPHDQFLVAMVGAFHYRKGHDHLIKAISLLKKKGIHNIGAVIVGGMVGREKWEILAKEEDVVDQVHFLTELSETKMNRLHHSVDGYANLSNSPRSCGLDLALLEAMSSGLPIVVYDNGALPTSVPKEENGFLVKTGDIEGVADAILKLYKKSKEERKIMGDKSRALAQKCDINVTAEIKLGWFKDALKK